MPENYGKVYDAWLTYTEKFSTPQIFIKAGFLSMISAALQRNVWLGSLRHMPIFANQFVVFIAAPGHGKSIVIETIKKLLEELQCEPTSAEIAGRINAKEALQEYYGVAENKPSKNEKNDRALVKIAPDHVNYDALIYVQSQSVRTKFYKDPVTGKSLVYTHFSLAFILDELLTLFGSAPPKELTVYLAKMWDCSSYRKVTIGRGDDVIPNPCLNLLGGITTDNLNLILSKGMIQDGLLARMVFLEADKPRHEEVFQKDADPRQDAAESVLLKHLTIVAQALGQVALPPEVLAHLNSRFQDGVVNKKNRAIKDPRMDDFYTRKHMHARKLALALLFAQPWEKMALTIDHIDQAWDIVTEYELFTYAAMNSSNKSSQARMADTIVTLVERHGGSVAISTLYSTLGATYSKGVIRGAFELAQMRKDIRVSKPGTVEIVVKNNKVNEYFKDRASKELDEAGQAVEIEKRYEEAIAKQQEEKL